MSEPSPTTGQLPNYCPSNTYSDGVKLCLNLVQPQGDRPTTVLVTRTLMVSHCVADYAGWVCRSPTLCAHCVADYAGWVCRSQTLCAHCVVVQTTQAGCVEVRHSVLIVLQTTRAGCVEVRHSVLIVLWCRLRGLGV